MPVTSQIGFIIRNNHEMKRSRWNREIAARAEILLDRLVRLNGTDGYVEKSAHAMTASIAAPATTTMTMSRGLFSWSRNGLNPTPTR